MGASYLKAIPQPLRPFYERFLAATPDAGTTLHPNSHVYKCSFPARFRKCSMQVYALRERSGFIVINSLVVEAPHDPVLRVPRNPDFHAYEDGCGFIVQCSHCRLVKHAGEHERWDWVPEWVALSPSNTRHGLCPCASTIASGQKRPKGSAVCACV